MRKPAFFIVGAAKSGTTSLVNYINQSDRVFIPEIKEPHFFGKDLVENSHMSLHDYAALFENVHTKVMAGEASTHYLCSRTAAAEIIKFNPRAKIIIILRNPSERSYSHYWFRVQCFRENRQFMKAFNRSLELMKDENVSPDFEPYASMSFYVSQVKRFLETFQRESVKILCFDDLQKCPQKFCNEVLEFLEVEDNVNLDTSKIYNKGRRPRYQFAENIFRTPNVLRDFSRLVFKKHHRDQLKRWIRGINNRASVPTMDLETRKYLSDVFRQEIIELQDLLKHDLSLWLKRS